MIKVEDLQLMAALAQVKSLSEAARSLNVTPSALSMRLRSLETSLGVVLATRTARRLSLSAEGEALAQEAASLLGRIEQLPEMFQHNPRRLRGSLKIAAPFGYGRQRVAPLMVRLARLHPELKLQLDLRETPWPDRQDADIVIHIGSVRDSSWVARTVAENQRWLCASPAYIKKHGMPQHPRDVLAHACICIRENDEDVSLWHFRREKIEPDGRAGVRESLRIDPVLVSNDGGTARYWAEQGLGFVLRSQWDVAESVRRGTLTRVLPDWQFDLAPVVVMVPSRKGLPLRVRVALDFFVAELAG
jgi:DNA-binding transcriptional LysR family regulator